MDVYPNTERGCIESPGHRLVIHRRWDLVSLPGVGEYGPPLIACLQNPSTADRDKPDPTLSKVCGYAQRWRCGGVIIVNPWTHRATDPADFLAILRHGVPQDPRADEALGDVFDLAANDPRTIILAGWGSKIDKFPGGPERIAQVIALAQARGLGFHALAVSKDGHPIHPLYLSYELKPLPWPRSRSAVAP